MRTGNVIGMVLFLCVLAAPGVAQEAPAPAAAPAEAPNPDGLVVGENVVPGMPLSQAIELLGVPGSLRVNRGPIQGTDSIQIDYEQHGLILHAMSNGSTVEGIEVGPSFKGKFASGIKLGDKFPMLIENYGVPNSLTSQVARYPDRGLYFLMNNDTLLSAKAYAKGTKLVDARLMNP